MRAELAVPVEHAIFDPLLIDSSWEPTPTTINRQDAAADSHGAAGARRDIAVGPQLPLGVTNARCHCRTSGCCRQRSSVSRHRPSGCY
jgi:hypothetical protein